MMKSLVIKGLLIVGMASSAMLAGCTAVSAIAYQANGPSAIPAKYVPPKEPMLLLVENFSGGAVEQQDTSALTVTLTRELKDAKVAPLVDPDVLEKLHDSMPADTYGQMTISQIGKACGAKQVLYVHVLGAQVNIPDGSQSISGQIEVRVKIVDVASGHTRWPDTDQGSPETITSPVHDNGSPAVTAQVHDEMANLMGIHIGNLFHDWKPQFENQETVETTGTADGMGSQ